jgi:hypothetical protein
MGQTGQAFRQTVIYPSVHLPERSRQSWNTRCKWRFLPYPFGGSIDRGCHRPQALSSATGIALQRWCFNSAVRLPERLRARCAFGVPVVPESLPQDFHQWPDYIRGLKEYQPDKENKQGVLEGIVNRAIPLFDLFSDKANVVQDAKNLV